MTPGGLIAVGFWVLIALAGVVELICEVRERRRYESRNYGGKLVAFPLEDDES